MESEIVYLGHNNSIDKILKANGAPVALTSVDKVTLTFGTTLVESDNGAADPIRWDKVGYATGEVRFFLGGQNISAGAYRAPLIVYDPTNTDGVVWGFIPLMVMADPEAAAAP